MGVGGGEHTMREGEDRGWEGCDGGGGARERACQHVDWLIQLKAVIKYGLEQQDNHTFPPHTTIALPAPAPPDQRRAGRWADRL